MIIDAPTQLALFLFVRTNGQSNLKRLFRAPGVRFAVLTMSFRVNHLNMRKYNTARCPLALEGCKG